MKNYIHLQKNVKTAIALLLSVSLLSVYFVSAGSAGYDNSPSEAEVKSEFLLNDSAQERNFENGGYVFNEGEEVKLSFECKKGDYNIELKYAVKSTRNETVNAKLTIDGELPFAECESVLLPVLFEDTAKTFKKDRNGGQIPAELQISAKAVEYSIKDNKGMERLPYVFSLSEGKHTFSLEITDGSIIFYSVSLKQAKQLPKYDEYLSDFDDTENGKGVIRLNTERPLLRTSKSILEFCDSSDASVEPQAEQTDVMNAIGGSQWSASGQAAVWSFDVKSSGFYTVSLKYNQGYTNGRSTYRCMYIDGEIPFYEAANISFPYTGKWEEMQFSQPNGCAYKIWLEKGAHTLALSVSLGDMSEIIKQGRELLTRLNDVYRRIIMLTGANPDSYRDYQLKKKIPETIEEIGSLSTELYKLIDTIENVQSEVSQSGSIKRLAVQLERFFNDNDKITSQLSQFQTNISAFGTWINDCYSQPLALDEIEICGAGENTDFYSAGFFSGLLFGTKQFIYSFIDDYRAMNDERAIDVWVPTGRDQMQIIKTLTSQYFTEETGITANLKLISESALIPAVVAGEGPDVALMCPQSVPVNFALRKAVLELSGFEDFDDVCKELVPDSLIPYRFQNGIYALPETLSFSMLFYRKDILNELNLKIPETWDDVIQIIIDLGHNNMQFGFSGDLNNFATLLFQRNGKVYSDDGSKSAFSEETALEAFEAYTNFYNYYKIPVTFDFPNRFRNGQMPVGIANYVTYNTLQIFASEIDGLWDIAPVPGTVGAEGELNTAVVGSGTACVIIADSKHPDEAWEFIKWWISSETQKRYGLRVEEKLGASARYATANTVALNGIPWSGKFYKELSSQLENVTCIPEVPGGYFTSRHFNNAFRKVVYKNQNARETLLEYTDIINQEITDKRTEFGLETGGKQYEK